MMSLKNTLLPIQYTLQSHGRLMNLATPVIMGILNVTPDSFFTKGRNSDTDGLLFTAEKMLKDGAAILDIGGASTRPGSSIIDTDEELNRVIPAVEAIHRRFPDVWLSADTYHARVAGEAVAAGVSIINDISSGSIDSNMITAVAKLKVPYIAMHMQGTPETMQQNPQYNDVSGEVRSYLADICNRCAEAGIADVIIDPGFGFGKTVSHNFTLLRELHTFRIAGKPLLAGISRKSMICKTLRVSPEHALNGTTALHMEALRQGANILRVHDVREAMEVIKLHAQLTAI